MFDKERCTEFDKEGCTEVKVKVESKSVPKPPAQGTAVTVKVVSLCCMKSILALFGFSSNDKWYFTQAVNNDTATLGSEVSEGAWGDSYDALTLCQPDNQHTYIFGCQASGARHWFLQQVLDTGVVGNDTDSGSFDGEWSKVCSYVISGQCYIFAHSGSSDWFIQEVTTAGKLGTETSRGKFSDYYPALCVVTVGNKVLLYGQGDSKGWFLQELLVGGKLATSETDHGSFSNFYPSVCSFSIDGRTFLFGQSSSSKNRCFIQEVLASGQLGKETDSKEWGNFYQTVTAFTINGKVYLFAQTTSENNLWFIQSVLSGGKFGQEIERGKWRNFYNFVGSLSIRPLVPADRWMTEYKNQLATRTLKQIVIPGAHDAGMYESVQCTSGGFECNTRTQSLRISGQLEAGIRYFDLRPILTNSGEFRCGHFSEITVVGWQGCYGGSVSEVLSDVAGFLGNSSRSGELIILKFSHYLDIRTGSTFSGSDLGNLVNSVTTTLGTYLYKNTSGTRLSQIVLGSLLQGGSKVLAVFDSLPQTLRNPAGGIYRYVDFDPDKPIIDSSSDLVVFDNYAKTNDLGDMAEKQNGYLNDPKTHGGDMFLYSWTLTQSNTQSVTCMTTVGASIEDLAVKANSALAGNIATQYPQTVVTTTNLPNIIYVDYCTQMVTQTGLWLLNKLV